MNDSKPKITVVTICYNTFNCLESTMLSVLNQSYDNVEYIVIDGGSNDGTVDIIKKYADRLAYWVSEPDKGIYDAMNKGIKAATGEWINFMNAGDRFFSETVLEEVFVKYLPLIKGDIVYGDSIFVYPKGKLYVKPRRLENFHLSDPILHQSSFTKLEIMKSVLFDTNYRLAADYNFFYNEYQKGTVYYYVPIPMSYFDAADGLSSNAVALRMEENRIITNAPADFRYILRKLITLLKFRLRRFLEKFMPSLSSRIQFWNLTRNPRINRYYN